MKRWWNWLTENHTGDPDVVWARFLLGPFLLAIAGLALSGTIALIIALPLVAVGIVVLLIGGWTLGRVLFK